jgi:hypothetical protein
MENSQQQPATSGQPAQPPQIVVSAVTGPPGKSSSRTTMEFAGVGLGVVLMAALLGGLTGVAKFAIIVFAIIGGATLLRDLFAGKRAGSAAAAGSQGGATHSGARHMIVVAGITLATGFFVIVVLPYLGLFLLLMFIMVVSGGNPGD